MSKSLKTHRLNILSETASLEIQYVHCHFWTTCRWHQFQKHCYITCDLRWNCV